MATIQEIYIALFGRPADPEGLAFWMGETKDGADLSTLIGRLTNTGEALERFEGMDYAEVVSAVYQALFGRTPEPAGLSYFMEKLENGSQTLETIAIHILDGAQEKDRATVDNKAAAAQRFTDSLDTQEEIDAYKGKDAADVGRNYIAKVNDTEASVPTERTVTDVIDQDLLHKTPPKTGGGDSGEHGSKVFDVDFSLIAFLNKTLDDYNTATTAAVAHQKLVKKAEASDAAADKAEADDQAAVDAKYAYQQNDSEENYNAWIDAHDLAEQTDADQLRADADNDLRSRDAAKETADAKNVEDAVELVQKADVDASAHGPTHFVVGKDLLGFSDASADELNFKIFEGFSSSPIHSFGSALKLADQYFDYNLHSTSKSVNFVAIDVGQDSYIFYDNGDGSVDAAVKLTGISTTQYDFNIIAGGH